MAALTVATATQPPDARRLDALVYTTLVSGAGTTATEVVAAVADKQTVITGGVVSWDGGAAETLEILSDSTVLFTVEMPAVKGNLKLPHLYTEDSEALNVHKSGAVASVNVHVEYATITAGDPQHLY